MVLMDSIPTQFWLFFRLNQWTAWSSIKMWQGTEARGPPLPILFILGVGILSRILKLAYKGSFVQKVGPWNLGIPCLQYADDTIMLLPSDLVSIKRVKNLIYMFKVLSGLSINFHKSSLYPLGPLDLDKSQISALLHCRGWISLSPTWDFLLSWLLSSKWIGNPFLIELISD